MYKVIPILVGNYRQNLKSEQEKLKKPEDQQWNRQAGRCDTLGLAERMENLLNDAESKGYEVISIVPIIRNDIPFWNRSVGGSSTEGVVITIRKPDLAANQTDTTPLK